MLNLASQSNDDLLKLIDRRHPEYCENIDKWDFFEDTYEGGRDWFEDGNIFRYLKEGEKEYKDRVNRAYRFNHTREVTDLIQKYIFKSEVSRKEDAPDYVKSFWENSTLSNLEISQYMRLICNESSKLGRIWVFLDTTKNSGIVSKKDEKDNNVKIYSYIIKPQNMLDFAFDKDGYLNWCIIKECYRDDETVISSGEIKHRYRIWTKDSFAVLTVKEEKGVGKKVVVEEDSDNPFGFIPGFFVDNLIGNNKYTAPSLVNDIAYLDRAVANYLSNLDAIIQDQTFSQLAMPAQSVISSDKDRDQLMDMGTKRIFLYDGEGGGVPIYLSPDIKQAELIITAINKIINEIYHSLGMAGERTKQDNAVGIDNSSGVAKAYDFERLNSLLMSKASSLENAENQMVSMVCRISKNTEPKDELVEYPDTFDVRSLFDDFTVAQKLLEIGAPDEIRREQMKQVVDKLFPQIADEVRTKLIGSVEKDWPIDITNLTNTNSGDNSNPSKKNPQTKSLQGQVTGNTNKPK